MEAIQEFAQLLSSMRVVDLSPTFSTNMPGWHSHPDVMIVEDARTFAQHGYFLQTMVLPEHSGCHVDAPAHILVDKADQTIDLFPANALFGMAKTIDLSQENYSPGDLVPLSKVEEVMRQANIALEKGDIAIFDFGYEKYLIDEEKQRAFRRNWWGKMNQAWPKMSAVFSLRLASKLLDQIRLAVILPRSMDRSRLALAMDSIFCPMGFSSSRVYMG